MMDVLHMDATHSSHMESYSHVDVSIEEVFEMVANGSDVDVFQDCEYLQKMRYSSGFFLMGPFLLGIVPFGTQTRVEQNLARHREPGG